MREQQTVKERQRGLCGLESSRSSKREREREREVNCYDDKRNYIKKIIMRCKIVMREKMM